MKYLITGGAEGIAAVRAVIDKIDGFLQQDELSYFIWNLGECPLCTHHVRTGDCPAFDHGMFHGCMGYAPQGWRTKFGNVYYAEPSKDIKSWLRAARAELIVLVERTEAENAKGGE